MRHFMVLGAALALFVQGAGRAHADKVEVKGPHLCCGQCVKIAEGLLAKVEGVSDAKAEAKTKTVSFTAADEKAAKAGIKALIDGGFFGTATCEGKEMKITVPGGEGKADEVVVEKVHVCCGLCQKGINALFKDAKITYEEKGPQRTVRIQGSNLDRNMVLETLRKAGFNGTLAK